MQEAIRSAPSSTKSGVAKKSTAGPTSPSPALPHPASVEEEQEMIIVDETTPIPAAPYLKFYVKQLEGMLRMAADFVMCSRGPFETYRPLVTKLLGRIAKVGGTKWFEHCSAGVSYVEETLQAFQELKRVDLSAEIAKSLVHARAERASQKGVKMTEAQLTEEVTKRVEAEHNSKLADLTLRLTVIHLTDPTF